MQKIVGDRLRPEGKADAYGVELAKAQLQQAYGVMEREMDSKTWAIGDDFTLAYVPPENRAEQPHGLREAECYSHIKMLGSERSAWRRQV